MNKIDRAQQTFCLLDQVPLGSFILQSDYTVLFWNCCLEGWTKIPRAHVLGTSIHQHFPHLHQPRYLNRLRLIFQGGPPTIFSSQLHSYIIPVPLPHGRHRVQHTTVTSVPALEGGGFYALFSIQDVTDLTFQVQEYKSLRDQALAVAEERQQAKEAAEAANRIKDEFLAIVSHELRSPLNPILGWSKLLKTQSLNAATTARALETIERNAHQQAQLIDDLLDVSRILQGKLVLNFEAVNLVSIIEAALETVRLAAEAKSIGIKLELDPAMPPVSGDASRLQQVVWNLLSNAVKFTPPGGQVEVSVQPIGAQAQIQVQDTGQGIRSDFLPYVFEYFRQADSSTTRSSGGLGLGLAIVRKLVELHGGKVWAESLGEGCGSVFTVHLPLPPDHPPAAETLEMLATHVSLARPHPTLNGLRVLIVDDDVDTREFIAFLLEQQGAIVTAAASAQEALLEVTKAIPDLLLSDLGMPEMDGYALIQQLRSLPPDQGGQIPAIALTAYAAETTQQKVVAAGFQRHIAKPADPVRLIAAIAALVRQRNG